MARKKDIQKRETQQRLKKTVFCPLCGTTMRFVRTKAHQHTRDNRGLLVEVSRVFYGCPNGNCNTVIWFDYREDGKVGDLRKKLALQKVTGSRTQGLGGSFTELF